MKWMSRFLLTLLAVVMLGDTMPVSAQVSSGSTNAAQQNAASSEHHDPANSGK
jgi:hypothetical protein